MVKQVKEETKGRRPQVEGLKEQKKYGDTAKRVSMSSIFQIPDTKEYYFFYTSLYFQYNSEIA